MAREKPQLLTLSDAAAERIRDIVANSDTPIAGVRLGVAKGGCAGMSYTMDTAEKAVPGDEVVETKGVTLFVDAKAVLFLIGTEVDFVREKMGARFVFNNPNQTAACGCGESFSIAPAKAG